MRACVLASDMGGRSAPQDIFRVSLITVPGKTDTPNKQQESIAGSIRVAEYERPTTSNVGCERDAELAHHVSVRTTASAAGPLVAPEDAWRKLFLSTNRVAPTTCYGTDLRAPTQGLRHLSRKPSVQHSSLRSFFQVSNHNVLDKV